MGWVDILSAGSSEASGPSTTGVHELWGGINPETAGVEGGGSVARQGAVVGEGGGLGANGGLGWD